MNINVPGKTEFVEFVVVVKPINDSAVVTEFNKCASMSINVYAHCS
jgi:hypothetical protein